ncbi:MAG: glucose/sorbosone dehydrogenase [Alphaproteobacteria bacterium]|nr:glucose/sorbosone dehydrogenase [Alphaproteobacteria bacterium]
MKTPLLAALMLAAVPAFAAEPDGLVLPSGFHASVVADGLGPIRHLAVSDKGDLYVSTKHGKDQPALGIIALRLGPDHKAVQTEHFSSVDQGTGIRIYKGSLYAASGTGVYRFALGDALVPTAAPELIVDGLAATNHPIAFDGRGNIYVSIDGGGGASNCPDPANPKDAKPKGLKPCPLLETRGGIWRFDVAKPGQKLADGEHFATGIRNSSALAWHDGDALYSAWHGRDATAKTWPEYLTAADDDAIADEMFKVTKGTDMGWPYTYWDGAKGKRLLAPDYGGDGKTEAESGKYATPVAAFQPMRPAVLDMTFYTGSKFPRAFRSGAFLAMHGGGADGAVLPGGHAGYNVMFVPFANGRAGKPVEFAGGFAGEGPGARNTKTAAYRPVGVAVGPDGALYVAESNKGRIWRISYGE